MGQNDKIRYSQDNIFGQPVYVGRRTGAHLDWTKERLAERHPDARLIIIQGAFNTSVPASEGTHDYDAVLDVQIVGMDWWDAQRFLRECGWGAWYRYPPSFSNHIHMISLGCTGRVGFLIPGQITDYRNHALGLQDLHTPGCDPSWHPPNIDRTIFDYDAYLREDDMPSVKDLLDASIGQATVRDALRAAVSANKKLDRLVAAMPRIAQNFLELDAEVARVQKAQKDDASAASVAALRQRIAATERAIMHELTSAATAEEQP